MSYDGFVIKIAGVLILAYFLFGQVGCDNLKSKEEAAARAQKNREVVENFFLKPSERKIQLLGIKYEVPPEKIQIIIEEYLSSHDIIYKLMKADVSKAVGKKVDSKQPTIVETVSLLSDHIAIPKTVIASIIIDYEIWSAAESGGPTDVE